MQTYQEFAATRKDTDPLDTIKAYRDSVSIDLLKSGQYDDALVADIDKRLFAYADGQGLLPADNPEIAYLSRPDDADYRDMQRHVADEGVRSVLTDYLAASGDRVREAYGSDTEGYRTRLDESRAAAAQAVADPAVRNDALKAATLAGDRPFAVLRDADGSESLFLSPELRQYSGNDEALASLFEANPGLDRTRIGEIRSKLRVPEGYDKPLFDIERQGDFLSAVSDAAAKDPVLGSSISSLKEAADKGITGTWAETIGRIDADPGLAALRAEFPDADERKAFLEDYVKRVSAPAVNEEDVDANVMVLSTGERVLPLGVMLNRKMFDRTLAESTNIPDAQKDVIRATRDQQVSALAPDSFRIIAENRSDFTKFLDERKAQGKSNAEILDEWMSDPENYSSARSYLGGIGESLIGAVGGWFMYPAALAGNPAATKALQDLQESTAERKAYAQLFGKNLDWKYELATLIAPVAADITATLATGGAAATVVAAKTSVRSAMRETLRTALSAGTKNLLRNAVTRRAPGASIDEAITIAGRDLANTLTRGATTSAMLGTAFNRSAGSTYVQLLSTLSEQKNPDGTPKYTPEKAREIALNHGLVAGAVTAAVTGGFSFLGRGGVESIYDGLTARQWGRIARNLRNDFDKLAPSVREGLDPTNARTLLDSVIRKSVKPLFLKAGQASLDEAGEEALDQFIGYFNQSIATGEKINPFAAAKEALYAGMLGGMLGGGVVTLNETVRPADVGRSTEESARRSVLLDTAALAEKGSLPQTAAALRDMAVRGVPVEGAAEAPAPEEGTTVAPEEGDIEVPAEEMPEAPSPEQVEQPTGEAEKVGGDAASQILRDDVARTESNKILDKNGDTDRKATQALRDKKAADAGMTRDEWEDQQALQTVKAKKKFAASLSKGDIVTWTDGNGKSRSGVVEIGLNGKTQIRDTTEGSVAQDFLYDPEVSNEFIMNSESLKVASQPTNPQGRASAEAPSPEHVEQYRADRRREIVERFMSRVPGQTWKAGTPDEVIDEYESLTPATDEQDTQGQPRPQETPETPRPETPEEGPQGRGGARGGQAAQTAREIIGEPRQGFDNQFTTPEGATVELLPDGRASFIVPPAIRGQGAGNSAVERVKRYADATGTPISLDIEPIGNEPGMTRGQLADWYERRGFSVSGDRMSAVYVPGGAVTPSEPAGVVVGEMSDFQKAAQAITNKEYDTRSPEFFTYDDTYQVDPSRLPEGAKYFPEEGEAQYYVPQPDGSWNLIWKDLEGSTRVTRNETPPTQTTNEQNTEGQPGQETAPETAQAPLTELPEAALREALEDRTPVEQALASPSPELAVREADLGADLRAEAEQAIPGLDTEGLPDRDILALLSGRRAPGPVISEAESPVTAELVRYGFQNGLGTFLANVAKNGPPHQRRVAKLLARFPEPRITLTHSPKASFAGAFIPSTRQILVNTAIPGPRGGADTLLHELLHAATYDSLLNPTPDQAVVLRRLERIRRNALKRARKLGKNDLLYGLGTMDEFMTHFLTSPAFQNEVSTLTPKGERNWIEVILDAIRDLLNGRARTQTERLTDEVVRDMVLFVEGARPGLFGLPRMDQLLMQPMDARLDSRFYELTEDLGEDVEAWRAANPEKYAELERMRADVLKDAGYDVGPVYHGTPNGNFTEFDASNQGATGTAAHAFWFTEDRKMAENFANLASTKGENPSPVVVSALLKPGDKPSKSDFKDIPAGRIGFAHSKRASVISRAKREGRSSVKFTNMFDFGGPATVHAVFDPSQIKSAEPILRDDNGDLIPPSRWGDEESPDIRFQPAGQGPVTPEQDAAHLAAVERGDMETAQKMVYEAAKAAGIRGPYLHGTSSPSMSGAFRTGERDPGWFGAGAYLTRYESYAKRWGQNVHRFFIPEGSYAEISVRNNYRDIRYDAPSQIAHEDAGGDAAQIENEEEYASRFRDSLVRQGFSGVMVSIDGNPEVEVVVFDPSQIKSADPVTYDNDGNAIPLSQRFNPESPDIRFQQPEPAEQPPTDIRALAESFNDTADPVDLDYDEIARMTEGLDPVNTEAVVRSEVNRSLAHRAGLAVLADVTPEEADRLLSVYQRATSGSTLRSDIAFYRTNPTSLERLRRYLSAALNRMWERLKLRFDHRTSVYVERLTRALAKAERGYRVGGEVKSFDPVADDVMMQPAEQTRAGFYSQLERVIGTKVQGKQGTPDQIKALIRNPSNGIRAEEIKWSGVEQKIDELASENNGKVPKEALLEYLRNEGAVRFEEVVQSDVQQPLEWKQRGNTLEARSGKFGASIEKRPNGKYQLEIGSGAKSWHPTIDSAKAEAADRYRLFGTSAVQRPTKFSQYTLPGGESYREVVLAMPRPNAALKDAQNAAIKRGDYEEASRIQERINATGETVDDTYTSSHFPDVPNYVAHMRLNERTDADGAPGLFIEELQSDRHQAGRKSGYASPRWTPEEEARARELEAPRPYPGLTETEREEYRALLAKEAKSGIAPAPYQTTWPLALFKRALRDAVAGGKTWIGWTTGETQNDRFDLSKQVNGISVPMVNADGSRSVRIEPKEGTSFKMMVDGDGIVDGYQSASQFTGKRLDEVVGKDMADKIMALDGPADFEGDGLKVGGSGMKGFYDNMLPKEIGKYVKQWGAKVEKGIINKAPSDPYAQVPFGQTEEGDAIWRIDITPSMRGSVSEQGQPLFQHPAERASKVGYLRAHEGSHVLQVKGTDKPFVSEAGLRGFFQRIIHVATTKNDLIDPMAEAATINAHLNTAVQNHARKLGGLWEKAVTGITDERAMEILPYIEAALGSTAPLLTNAEADRINSEVQSRLEASAARRDARIAEIEDQFRKKNIGASERDASILAAREISAAEDNATFDYERDEKIRSEIAEASERRRLRDLAQSWLDANEAEVGRYTRELRETITDAQVMLKDLLGEDHPMHAVIDRSQGIYLVRSFAVHQNPELIDSVLNDAAYEPQLNALRAFFEDQLVGKTVERLRRRPGLANATDAELEAMAAEERVDTELRRLRRRKENESVDDDTLREVARLNVAEQAQTMVEDFLLGHKAGTSVTGTDSDIKRNVHRFMHKRNLDPAILDALLEIKDPVFNAANTFVQVAGLVRQEQILRILAKQGTDSGLFVSKDAVEADPRKYHGWKPLVSASNSRAWAPLATLHAEPHVVEAFQSVFHTGTKDASMTADKMGENALRFIRSVAGASLGVTTLGNPGYYTRNVVGNLIMLARQGYFPDADLARSFRASWNSAFSRLTDDAEFDAFVNEMTALGILSNGAHIQYVRELIRTSVDNPSGAMAAVESLVERGSQRTAEAMSKAKDVLKAGYEMAANFSQVTEEFSTLFAMMKNIEMLTEAGYGTTRQIYQEAARRTKLTMPSKSEASQSVAAFTKHPVSALLAPFLRFKTEIFRTYVNTYRQAVEDIRSDNEVIRRHGRRTLASAMTVDAVVTVAMPFILAAMSGIGDDEDRLIRAAMPAYDKNTNFWFVRGTDGKLYSYNLSYVNPGSLLGDPFVSMLRSTLRGDVQEIPEIGWRVISSEVFGENIVAGKVNDVRRNKNESTGLPIWQETDDWHARVTKSVEHIGSSFVPAVVRNTDKMIDAMYRPGKEDEPFLYTPLGVLIGQFLPTKARPLNPEDLGYRAFSSAAAANRQLWQITAPLKNPMGYNPTDVADVYDDLQRANYKIQRDIHRYIEGMKGLGVPMRRIAAKASGQHEGAGISRERFGMAVRGEGRRKVLDSGTLDKIGKINPAIVEAWKERQKEYPEIFSVK